jgi:hypothetical protein
MSLEELYDPIELTAVALVVLNQQANQESHSPLHGRVVGV